MTAWPLHLPVLPSCRRAILRVPDSSTPTTADSRRMSERPRPEGYVDLVYGGYPTKGGEEEADM
uniref:Uncharacterized protein n=1 Tax=Oryza rufipogon TaxID=4529 RepID=A0A0E0RBZ8_ORYRU